MRRLASLLLLMLIPLVLQAQDLPTNMQKLGNKMIRAINDGNQEKADSLADRYLALCTSDKFRYGPYYAEAKHVKARTAAEAGDYASAQAIMDVVLNARLDKNTDPDLIRIGDSYFDRSEYHFLLKHTDQAISDMQAAAEAYQKGKNDTLYAKALCQKAYFYNRRGAPGDAEHEEKCYEEAFNNAKEGTEDYLLAGNHWLIALRERGETKKANKLDKQLQKIAKKVSKARPLSYADIMLNTAVKEIDAGEYAMALDDANKAILKYEENSAVNLNYGTSLKTAADALFHLEQYEKADALYEKALPILQKIEDAREQVYPGCLRQLVATNTRLGHPDKVAKYTKELDKLLADINDTSTLEYADLLATQAQVEAKKGNYSEAIAKGEDALSRYQVRNNFRRQVFMHNVLSSFYSQTGHYTQAESHSKLAIKISQDHHLSGEESEAHHQEAKSLLNKREYQKADEECVQALSLLRKASQAKSTKYASILGTRAVIQDKLGHLQTAIGLTREALDLQTEILGAEHGKNVKLLDNLAIFYDKLGNMDSVAYYYHRAITLQTELVRNNFSLKGTEERELFWQRENYPYQRAVLYAAEPDKTPPRLCADIYNAQLFTKGILLNSEIDFRKVLQKFADKEVLLKYDEMMAMRTELQQYQTTEEGGTAERIEQLKQDINRLENDIVYQCKEFGDFTQSLKLTTDSIRQALAPDEAAVEFLETGVTYDGQPDRLYLALIMRSGWDAPRACQLFFRSEIEGYPANVPVSQLLNDTIYQNRIYKDSKLGRLVWKNLLKEIDGATRIYFAPTGIFYQWGIEYMPITDEGTRISDTLSVYRLSSTKLLAQRNGGVPALGEGEVVIYGGLDYNMSKKEVDKYKDGKEEVYESYADYLIPEDLTGEASVMLASADIQNADSLAVTDMTRQGIVPVGLLKGANEEAGEIENILRSTGRKTRRYGAYGTEGSFRALSGRGVSLLHIATHGFSTSTLSQQQDPLASSGLLFAGCNYNHKHPGVLSQDNNGILTAQEIALLNLQGLQLTVLSACQTGLGELKEDGVFGVQRGFKKAGAHTLVMSLWSVDDAATRLMMTTFYEGLISGLSRHDAFLNAQQTVREVYPQPHYWAPFIMLDDI